jgi:hypothetical protein
VPEDGDIFDIFLGDSIQVCFKGFVGWYQHLIKAYCLHLQSTVALQPRPIWTTSNEYQ